MPNYQYCTCGKKSEYTLEKNKFCPGCGKSFTAIFATTPSKPTPIKRIKSKLIEAEVEEDEDNEITETNFNPDNIDGLEIEIEKPQSKRQTIGNIIGQGKIGVEKRSRDKSIPKSKKDIEKWLLEQSKTTRVSVGGDEE